MWFPQRARSPDRRIARSPPRHKGTYLRGERTDGLYAGTAPTNAGFSIGWSSGTLDQATRVLLSRDGRPQPPIIAAREWSRLWKARRGSIYAYIGSESNKLLDHVRVSLLTTMRATGHSILRLPTLNTAPRACAPQLRFPTLTGATSTTIASPGFSASPPHSLNLTLAANHHHHRPPLSSLSFLTRS
jgi:hypothetical protein